MKVPSLSALSQTPYRRCEHEGACGSPTQSNTEKLTGFGICSFALCSFTLDALLKRGTRVNQSHGSLQEEQLDFGVNRSRCSLKKEWWEWIALFALYKKSKKSASLFKKSKEWYTLFCQKTRDSHKKLMSKFLTLEVEDRYYSN